MALASDNEKETGFVNESQMTDFIGVAAVTMNENLEKECFVIGLDRMPGAHTAENIKKAIEKSVNCYDWDNSKTSALVSDEGSNFLCVFKPYEDTLEDFEIDLEAEYEEEEDDYEDHNDNDDEDDAEEDDDEEDEDDVEEIESDEDEETEPTMKKNESEINSIILDINNLEFNHVSPTNQEFEKNFIDENINSADDDEDLIAAPYDDGYKFKGRNKKFDDLNIEFRRCKGKKIPRFSCACHKCNIAVRNAIKSCPGMAKDLVKLSKYTKSVRKSNKKANPLKIEKCRLRCENKTRWSSSFLNLLSVYRAYKRGCELPDCPLKFEKVEFYLQILLPAYRFNIGFQRTKSSIAEVVPALLAMFNTWNKMSENINYRTICLKLIASFRAKFTYELDAGIYSVAALLNTSKLSLWYSKGFSEENVNLAEDELINIAFTFMKPENQEKVSPKKKPSTNKKKSESDEEDYNLMVALLNDDSDDDRIKDSKIKPTANQILRKEKEIFFKLISKEEETSKSTKNFWLDNKKNIPNLFKVAQFALAVPASSAFIERFFSVCGVICKKNCGNISDDLIVKRSFLKCNMDMLNALKNP